MTQGKSPHERLEKLKAKLNKHDKKHQAEQQRLSSRRNGDVGRAYTLGINFISYVLAGFVLGFGFDKLLSTEPWGMIILTILGFVSAVYQIIKSDLASNSEPK